MIKLEFWTDGSSDNNKAKNAGWSTVLLIPEKKPIIWYGHLETPSTNNQGEMLGIMCALYLGKTFNDKFGLSDVDVFSDSQYSIDMLDPNCLKSANKNVEYIRLGIAIQNQIRGKIEFIKVKGHSGIFGNELADKFAVLGRKQMNVVADPRYTTKYFDSKQSIFDLLQSAL